MFSNGKSWMVNSLNLATLLGKPLENIVRNGEKSVTGIIFLHPQCFLEREKKKKKQSFESYVVSCQQMLSVCTSLKSTDSQHHITIFTPEHCKSYPPSFFQM